MNVEHSKFTEVQWRRNYVTATAIEIGVGMQEMHGTRVAAQYMRVMGIRLDIAVRVLGSGKRRACWTSSLPPMQWRESTTILASIVYQDTPYGSEEIIEHKVAVKVRPVTWRNFKEVAIPQT